MANRIKVDTNSAKELAALTADAYDNTYYDPRYLDEGLAWLEDAQNGALFWEVRDPESRVLGVSGVWENAGKTGVLFNTIVCKALQNNGVGKELNAARIEYVKEQADTMFFVENRSHMPSSYIPLLNGGFVPVALAPTDVLVKDGKVEREYYYLSIANGRLKVSVDNPAMVAALQSAYGDMIEVSEDAETELRGIYKEHPLYNKITMVKNAWTGITSPQELLDLDVPYASDEAVVLYLTGMTDEACKLLSERGFRFNGFRPLMDFYTGDGREHNSNEAFPSLCIFTRLGKNEAVIPPVSPDSLEWGRINNPQLKSIMDMLYLQAE